MQVAAKKLTLKNVTDYIVDVICKRAQVNYNYGVILIPEGLIDFIPEVSLRTRKNLIYLVSISCALMITYFDVRLTMVVFNMLLSHSQVQHLIAELNEVLAHDTVDEGGLWKKKLTDQSLKLFEFLPQAIQEQLMLERDPHGNVQVLDHSIIYTGILVWLFGLNVQLEIILMFKLDSSCPGCQD